MRAASWLLVVVFEPRKSRRLLFLPSTQANWNVVQPVEGIEQAVMLALWQASSNQIDRGVRFYWGIRKIY